MDLQYDDSLLRACERLIEVRRLDLAERELGRWLSMYPEDAYGHALMAWTLTLQGRGEDALAAAGEAVKLEPDWAYTHAMKAEALEHLDRHAEAERAVREALALDPYNAGYHALLGAALLNQGPAHAREALRAADAGLAVDAGSVPCARLRAEALLRMGRLTMAREAARFTLHLAPDAPSAHVSAGWVERAAGNFEESREHLREALRIDPMNDDAARVLRLVGDGPRFCAALVVQVEAWAKPLAVATAIFAAELAALWARGRLDAFVLCYLLAMLAALEAAMLWVRIRHPRLLAESRLPGAIVPSDQRDARWALLLGIGILLLVPLLALLG